jgi:cytidine deaminase
MNWEPLIEAALEVRQRAYAPYSGYFVGAALLCADGTIHVGCNVENASYPVGFCAERSALAAAVSAGHRELLALVIATPGPTPGTPCGMCRQALNELAPDLPILLVTPGGARQEHTLSELLPGSFGPAMLRESIELSAQIRLDLDE